MPHENTAMVALGGNMPFAGQSPEQTLRRAITAVQTPQITVTQKSALFKTPCFPKGAGPDYVNAAVLLSLAPGLAATDLLTHLHAIETTFGRQRESRWGMRTLDLDLLAFGDLVLPDLATHARWRGLAPDDQARLSPPELILPHPRIQDRAFVLVPLADIAPDWVHPVLRRSVAQMLADLPAQDRADVQRLP